MASSSSPKQTRSTKPTGGRKSEAQVAFPLLLDPESWTILPTETVDVRVENQSLQSTGSRPRVHYVVDTSSKPAIGINAVLESSLLPSLASSTYFSKDWTTELLRSVIEATLESAKEVKEHQVGKLTTTEIIRQVAEALAEKAAASVAGESVEDEWQRLLVRGLKSKIALLKSKEFKSTTQASELLDLGEHAVRKRIKENRLFALRMPGDGEHRIPAWALDSKVTGATTASLLADRESMDEWRIYHFMTTPNGDLNGLRPFECLLSEENLPPRERGARAQLAAYRKLPPKGSLLELVKKAMKSDLEEGSMT